MSRILSLRLIHAMHALTSKTKMARALDVLLALLAVQITATRTVTFKVTAD